MEESTHSSSSSKMHGSTIDDPRLITGNPEIDNALSFWKQFDLSNARGQWDKICNEMREMKTSSISGRKKLNDLTKTFRAKPREEQVNGVSDLLKAYQEEIDQLSRRSKLSETSFFGLYKSLYDAPDPGYFLEQLLHTSLTSNSHVLEIEKLRTELSQYDEEFQRLKNQEVTIRRLEDQLAEFHQNIEQKVQEEVDRRAEILRQQCEQEVLEAKEMQKATERRLASAVESAKQAQVASDRTQSQLLEVSSRYEDRLSAITAENSLLAENIQRLQLRCNEMENENENLRKGASNVFHQSGGASPIPDSSDRQQSYELLISQLRQEMQEKEDRLRQERHAIETSLREVQQNYAKEKDALASARKELQERPSKKEFLQLKKRLRLVERVAFHSANSGVGKADGERGEEGMKDEEDDEQELDNAPENHHRSSDATTVPLENLLVTKIHNLEKDIVQLRKQNLELKENESNQSDVISSLKAGLENRQQTLLKLERELEARNGLLERMMKEQNSKKENALVDLADLLAEHPPPSPAVKGLVPNTSSTREGGGVADESSEASHQMISILSNQRDRYKERLTQAEATILKTEEALEAMKAAKITLEEENVQLYTKIKYLQNSSVTAQQSRGKRLDRSSSEESRYNHDRHTSDDIESKYDNLYEQRMNPFAEFSFHEKQRKLRELSVADRIVLNTTLAVIQSNTGRNFVLIYFGAMHLLVFFTIYYTAHNVHHGCDPALDHMAATTASAMHHGH